MGRFFHPLIMVLARAAESELARYVEYLKAENRILRSKLPKRVVWTPAERQRLVKLGKPPGSVIKDLITIVTPRSFARWVESPPPASINSLHQTDSRRFRQKER